MKTMIRTRAYREGLIEASDFDPALVSDYLEDRNTFVWLDLADPSLDQLKMLQEEFNLHPLAVEDAYHPHQRPKIDRYSNHLFAVIYGIKLLDGQIEKSEIDVFFSGDFLVTVRKDPSWPIEPVVERWDEKPELMKLGVPTMLYGLLDVVVDEYLDVANALRDRIEETGDQLAEHERAKVLDQEFLYLRASLGSFRRTIGPVLEGVEALLAGRLIELPEETMPYYKDIEDHLRRTRDAVEVSEETLVSALNLHLLLSSNRLNDIMKRVTSWGAIIAVATTIAGIYGMNFELTPSGENPYSFWIAVGLIVISSVALFLYFRRRDWL